MSIVRYERRPGLFQRVLNLLLPRSWASAFQNNKRHYDAAAVGRRTDGWNRPGTSANSANARSLGPLRNSARDLERNNPWATKGLGVITASVVGWGIRPLIKNDKLRTVWNQWASHKSCDNQGHLNFFGLQDLVMNTVALSGECLVIKKVSLTKKGFPLRLSVLEPDQLDTSKTLASNKNRVIQGIEVDLENRPVAFWIYRSHPGDDLSSVESTRVPAEDVIHVFWKKRPGQLRAPSWFSSSTVRLQDFDEYEDAALMRQKVAACYAAFRVNMDGVPDEDHQMEESLEPGMIYNLQAGEDIRFGTPPATPEAESFARGSLRGSAAGLHVSYEQMTGDFSQTNYSTLRMGQSAFMGQVNRWRWFMMVPMFCEEVWGWFLSAALATGRVSVSDITDDEFVEWAAPPAMMIDPEKEGTSMRRNIRSGISTLFQSISEQGLDPTKHLQEIAQGNKMLDDLGIVLDSDPRKTTDTGQIQQSKSLDSSENS